MLIGEGVGPETTAESIYVYITLIMGAVVRPVLLPSLHGVQPTDDSFFLFCDMFFYFFFNNIYENTSPLNIFESTKKKKKNFQVMSYLIGNISLVLSNANAIAAKHKAKMDEVLDSARAMKINKKLTQKIVAYYDLLWQRHRFLSTTESFIDELSPPLRKEVHLDLNKVIISRCDLFRGKKF
jgi:hypothetical protein